MRLNLNRIWSLALIASSVLVMLMVNIEALAQAEQGAATSHEKPFDTNITFSFTEFDFSQASDSESVFDNENQQTNQYKIHHAVSGDKTKPGIIFIHGTPGSWGAFERYLKNPSLQRDFFMVSVDRMGWGLSDLNKLRVDGDFDLQAESIAAIMREYPNKKWTIVGHSLGASIGPKIALITPNSVDSLLLLAGSLNPKLGRPRWYNWAANTWVVSSLIGKSMRYSNREIMALRAELKQVDAEIKESKLDAHLVVMQGAKDKLVSPKNPAYVANAWQTSFSNIELIELANEGHFLPWRQTPLVIETLYSLRAARKQYGRLQ